MRSIHFANRVWDIKSFENDRKGPGLNYWSDYFTQVWVTDDGILHLNVNKRDNKWYCSEIISQELFSYGTYTFDVEKVISIPTAEPDIDCRLGMFTFTPVRGGEDTREIDIELANFDWGGSCTAQKRSLYYTIWLTERKERRAIPCFPLESAFGKGKYSFTWSPEKIKFSSVVGEKTFKVEYTGEIPLPPVKVHLNLWFRQDAKPTNEQGARINNITFQPLDGYQPGKLKNTASSLSGWWDSMYVAGFEDYTSAVEFIKKSFNTDLAPLPVFFGRIYHGESFQFYGNPWVVFYTFKVNAFGHQIEGEPPRFRCLTRCYADIKDLSLLEKSGQFLLTGA